MKGSLVIAFLLCIALFFASGCTPSTTASTDGPHTIPAQYQANISTVYGSGKRITSDSLESDFAWKDSSGVTHTLAELKGKVVLVNFWAIWCVPCISEMPELQDIQNRFRADSVVVIGVSIDNGATPFADDKSFVDFKSIKYQIIVDANQDIYKNYSQLNAIPQTFVIDASGHIRHFFSGARNEQEYIDAINDVL